MASRHAVLVTEDRTHIHLSGDADRTNGLFHRWTAIARNRLNDSEFTGPAFADDGRVLFVNMQDRGLTPAVTGPREKYLG